MIKIFTTNHSPEFAGDYLQKQFNSWKEEFKPNRIQILNIHSNSNSYGWMLIIHYKVTA